MPDKVVFHIGSIKTGSTYLQKLFYEHRQELLDKGVDYIQFTPPRLDLPRWANADFLMEEGFDAGFVAEKLEHSNSPTVLISEEGLMTRPFAWQHDVFKGMKRVVLLYLRNPVELVASWSAENAQPYNFRQQVAASTFGVVSIDEGLERWTHQYGMMLRNAAKAFERDEDLEVLIRPYPPENPESNGLVRDFLNQVGLAGQSLDDFVQSAKSEPVNLGQSRKYCDASYMIANLANHYAVPSFYNKGFVDKIFEKLQSGDDRKVIDTLSNLQIVDIHNRLLGAMQQFSNRYSIPEKLFGLPTVHGEDRAPLSRVDPVELQTLFFEELIPILKNSGPV